MNLNTHRFYFWLFIFCLGSVAWAVAQEKLQAEKRWVRWRLIEVTRKSLADSILVQLQQGVSFQKLARQHSLHASAKEGGEIGWAALDSVDSEFKTAMVSLRIGGTSAILQKGNHFFILHKMNELAEIGYLQWKEQKAEVDSLLKRIESLIRTGNSSAAMTVLKETEERIKQIGDERAYLKMLNSKARILAGLGQFTEAANLFNSMVRISRTIGDTYWEGLALGNIGITYVELSQYQRAIAYYDSALGIARAIGDREGEGRHLGNIGNAHLYLSQYQRAIVYFDSSLVIARKIGDQGGGINLGNLGYAYWSMGQYQRAIAYFDSALGHARAIGNRRNEGHWLGNLGMVYRALGYYPRAIAYYDSALVIARKIGDRGAESSWLGNLGNVYGSFGQYQRAIAYHDSALVIVRVIGRRAREGEYLGSLGNAHYGLGEYQRAIAYHDSALSIARETGDRRGEGSQLGSLSDDYGSLGQYTQAIAYADSALFIAKEISDAENIWQWYWSLAKSHSKMHETQSHHVIAFYDSAVTALENISGQLTEDPHKLSFLENKQGLYQSFINYLLTQGKPTEQQRALEISEQARARAFIELIARRFHGSEVEQKRELLAPANFQQIQATAKRLNASILEYFISDSSLVIWLMKPEGQLHTAIVPIKLTHFDDLISMCQIGFTQRRQEEQAISTPQFVARAASPPINSSFEKFDFSPYMTELYQTLFPKEIRTQLPQQEGAKLLLVPHRKLAVIPIMTLKDSSGHYLLEKYNCHQVPGIGILLRTHEMLAKRQKPGKIQGKDMLLLGNPTMPIWGDEVLPPLREAEKEVTAIAKKYRAVFQSGDQASEYAFKQNAPDKRLLHFATHGISVDALPLESFVALAPGNGEDGQLTAAEILEMTFAADLAVLSACETGLGKISGDGVEGLARAFMASGVPSLVVSLWKVDDEPTRVLMLAFYEHLQQGLDKAEALRQAQLKIMRTPKWKAPKYWAAFVLYGEK